MHPQHTSLEPLPAPSQNLTSFLQQHPHHSDAYHAMGLDYLSKEQYTDALKHFDLAIRLSSGYHHFIHYQCCSQFLERGLCYLHLEQWEKALEDLEAAIFQDHYAQPALAAKAYVLSQLGKDSEELAYIPQYHHYNNAFTLDFDWQRAKALPHFIIAQSPSEQLYHQKKYQQAAEITEDPLVQAHSLFHLQRYEESLAILAQTTPQNASAYHDLAQHYVKSDQAEKAKTALAQAIALEPNHSNSHQLFGRIALDATAYEEALPHYDNAIIHSKAQHEHYHSQASIHRYSRGCCYRAMEKPTLAYMDFVKALDLDPGNIYAADEKSTLQD